MTTVKELFYILAIITVGIASFIMLRKNQKINDLVGELKDAKSDLQLEKLRNQTREARNKYVQAYTKYVDRLNDEIRNGNAVVFTVDTVDPGSTAGEPAPDIKH